MRTQNGFTLIEALVAVTIFGILLSVAMPSFYQLLHAQQLDSATQAMLRSLAIARHEAIKRGKPLTIAVREGEWTNGWFLFQDGNDNGRYDPDEVLLRAFPPVPSSTSLTGNSHVSSYIRYTPNGRATLLNGGYQMGTLKVCLKAQARGNTLVINNAGRVRYARGTDVCRMDK
jgi:type IV fimbrial biogenesis protein FimT